jgi:hypothetical protein
VVSASASSIPFEIVSKVRGRSPPASRVLEGCLQLRVAHESSSCRRSVLADRTLAPEMIRKVGSSGRVTFSLARGDGECQREPKGRH